MILLQNKQGLTLIEVIVALVLGLVLITAFTGALVVGLQTEGDMDERLEARRLTDDIIEYLRNNRDEFEDDSWEDNISDEFEKVITILKESESAEDDYDIIITWNKSDDLYEFKIDWYEINYSTEALIHDN